MDGANTFPVVWKEFLDWTEQFDNVWLASWRVYDPMHLKQDCRLHKLVYPFAERHLNLKKMFGESYGGPKFGMKRALPLSGLKLEGAHHRGIDDARNIVRIFRKMIAQKGGELEE